MLDLLRRVHFRYRLQPRRVIADTTYGTIENLQALEKGFANIERHIGNVKKFGVPVIVSINRFSSDTDAEMALLKKLCAKLGVECVLADHWAQGGAGATELAETVVRTVDERDPRRGDDQRGLVLGKQVGIFGAVFLAVFWSPP